MWVSGSSVYNYVKGNLINDLTETEKSLYEDYILRQGCIFEEKIYQFLTTFGAVKLEYERTIEPVKENIDTVINLMKQQIPIIYQAPLVSYKHKFMGTADILIHSFYINFIFSKDLLTTEEIEEGIYYCFDIKYHTLNSKKYLKNSIDEKYYKSQLFIYNTCLSEMQGKEIHKSFLWGRVNKYYTYPDSCNILNTVLIVDWKTDKDNYKNCVSEAVMWLNNKDTLREKELKKKILEHAKLGCITAETKNILVENKDARLIRGIKPYVKKYITWDDVNNIKYLPKFQQAIVDGVNKNIATIENIEWVKNISLEKSAFIDFEVFNNIFEDFSSFPYSNNSEYIYLIGVYSHVDKYKFFLMTALNEEEEKKTLFNFFQYIQKFEVLYHWSNAEKLWLEKRNIKLNLCDLLPYFESSPIVFPGMLNLKLKEVVKYWIKYTNYTEKLYDLYTEENGMEKNIEAYKIYQKNLNENLFSELYNVLKYNEADCFVMYELIRYLKELE